MVQIRELELTVGDVFQIGAVSVTVIDIENGEVTFRIDDGDMHGSDEQSFAESSPVSLPR